MTMKLMLTLLLFHTLAAGVFAQDSLNAIKIGPATCSDTAAVKKVLEAERKRGLVIDARPFAIDQSTGKLQFNGKTGRVSVVNLNPFIYKYTISVAQQELTSSAVTDFLDILLPPGLRLGNNQKDLENTAKMISSQVANDPSPLAGRLRTFNTGKCINATDYGCVALKAMKDEFDTIQTELGDASLNVIKGGPAPEFGTYEADLGKLRDQEDDAPTTCTNAWRLHQSLTTFDPGAYLRRLDAAKKTITHISSLASDLSDLVKAYFNDDTLKAYVVRCEGFNCANQFDAYAQSVNGRLQLYLKDLEQFSQAGEAMKRMLDLTNQMRNKEGVFARTFDVTKKFELTSATVTVARTRIEAKQEPANSAAENEDRTSKNHAKLSSGRAATKDGDDAGQKDEDDPGKDKDKDKEAKNDKSKSPDANQISESIQLGRPRFLLSGGLVFSPLARRTFENVKGFTRDATGNPTGDGNKNVVGFGENSPRRLMPMAILNTRLKSFNSSSVYFSLGVTAKHDDNVDLEYLIGPSVSLLNERALFTFGTYGGKVQNLVPDVRIGDEIPDSVGDAKLFTKRYSWKPGFSFSYVFSQTKKSGEASGGSGSGHAGDLQNEIRIGGIPFNLAMGLAYTSLEERTYDEIVGFARDRQGNLTNGQNLTRIVGLTSSASYRLAPLVLLHSRLINFGQHSFYFSTGVTGKKTDDSLQLEYLLGGTVNVFRRKMFVTFGTFAGKQQILGGDFYLGAKLDTTQNVTTQTRYVWKPAVVISYDISRIIPGGAN